AEELHLVPLQVPELRDDVTDPRPLRIELEPRSDVVGDVAEVRARLHEQVDAGREQQQTAQRALERDQPDEPPARPRLRRAHAGILAGDSETPSRGRRDRAMNSRPRLSPSG